MHGLCSEGNGNSTRLAKCPRDFVEAPSQMLENWCWQPSILARLSKHHETGDTLPTPLLDALVATKNVHESVFMLRQVCCLPSRTRLMPLLPPLNPPSSSADTANPLAIMGTCLNDCLPLVSFSFFGDTDTCSDSLLTN